MGKGNFLPILSVTLLVLVAAGFILFKSSLQNFPSPSPTPSVSETSLPPLYSEVKWGEIKEGAYLFPAKETVAIEKQGYWLESETVLTEPKDLEFFNYYKSELEKRGWSEYEVADGPDGGLRAYIREQNYYMVMTKAVSSSPPTFKLIIVYSK